MQFVSNTDKLRLDKLKKKSLDLVGQVKDWKELGEELKVPGVTLQEIHNKFGHDLESAKDKLVETWILTNQEASIDKLEPAIERTNG